MKIIDNVTKAEINLPNDLLWVDELDWVPTVSSISYSLTGSLICEQGTRKAGRPVHLKAPEDMAVVKRRTVEALRAAASEKGRLFTWVLEYPSDTRRFVVMFDTTQAPIVARPAKEFPQHDQEDWFFVEIKLLIVE